ncbi:putative glycolipid-binding domain-containing protein [Phytohabitans sp. ZYX-F-186]|uniref:Glycolipid-binding domain-containing protein n=1 Tax=Phytohabitans maris TaxID=3071409 RepID=A0ABU0ZN38_9ACTN|nr:putative glycolipid-binding domain-containing protein [Phytohabitans sp. ZYX-F-186]MDQ7908461.1 putative glycolipid-binding domain-containing protein [Phytohabitans sp. ZYX-F-186]
MGTLPKALLWERTDTTGTDLALLDDRRGLHARGVASAVDPIPYLCRYELVTDETWATAHLDVSVEGGGWLRTLRLERAAGRWRVTTAEQGDLDRALANAGHAPAGLPGTEEPDRLHDAIDVDLAGAALPNTLPIRRLGLLGAPPGTVHRLTMAWVLVPSLEVLPSDQTYRVVDEGTIRFDIDGFGADLSVDKEGYVLRYPGLAERKA